MELGPPSIESQTLFFTNAIQFLRVLGIKPHHRQNNPVQVKAIRELSKMIDRSPNAEAIQDLAPQMRTIVNKSKNAHLRRLRGWSGLQMIEEELSKIARPRHKA